MTIHVKTVFTEDSALNKLFDGRKARSEARQYVEKLKETRTPVLVSVDESQPVSGNTWLKSL